MAKTFQRLCPYCGKGYDLRLSPIVSAAAVAPGLARATSPAQLPQSALSLFDPDDEYAGAFPDPRPSPDEDDGDAPVPVVGSAKLPAADPVLWRPPVQAPVEPRRGVMRDLVAAPAAQSLTLQSMSAFTAEQMPRRGCPHCLRAMPREIDDRQLHVLAIVGVTGATKTHFFASAMGLAESKQALRDLGCIEFEVTAESSTSWYEDYYVPFFKKGEELKATSLDASVRFKSITFRVTFEGHEPFLLMTHDVSGEALSSEQTRAQVTPFIRRASGVVFMVDPNEFDELCGLLPSSEMETERRRRVSQGALLGHLLDEVEIRLGDRDIPVSVAVTKSDLLGAALGRQFRFAQASQRGAGWGEDILAVDAEVRALLNELGEVQLLQNAQKHRSIMFHAVSPAGGRPSSAGYTRPRPVRVEEPLGTVLRAISRAD